VLRLWVVLPALGVPGRSTFCRAPLRRSGRRHWRVYAGRSPDRLTEPALPAARPPRDRALAVVAALTHSGPPVNTVNTWATAAAGTPEASACTCRSRLRVGRGGGTSPTSGLARDPGNNWQPHGVRVHRRAGEIERVLLCPNCETLRTQVLSLDGYLLPTSW